MLCNQEHHHVCLYVCLCLQKGHQGTYAELHTVH